MQLNFLALLVAALIPLVMGFIWYHPKAFGSAWQREAGLTTEKMKSSNMALMFGLSFVFAFILSFGLNALASHDVFVNGAMYYALNGAAVPTPGSELANWIEYFNKNLSASCHNFKHGMAHGFFIAGACILLPTIVTNALFERKSWKYILINAGYWLITFMLMSGLLSAWK